MAKFENLGPCPANDLYETNWGCSERGDDSPFWPTVRRLLGDRPQWMYYPKDGCDSDGNEVHALNGLANRYSAGVMAFHESRNFARRGWGSPVCSVKHALRFSRSTLGVELATVLRTFIPFCGRDDKGNSVGRPILCFDIEGECGWNLPVQLQMEVYRSAGGEWFGYMAENRTNHPDGPRMESGVVVLQDADLVVIAVDKPKAVELYFWHHGDEFRIDRELRVALPCLDPRVPSHDQRGVEMGMLVFGDLSEAFDEPEDGSDETDDPGDGSGETDVSGEADGSDGADGSGNVDGSGGSDDGSSGGAGNPVVGADDPGAVLGLGTNVIE